MATKAQAALAAVLEAHEGELLEDWLQRQQAQLSRRSDLIKDAELRSQSKAVLQELRNCTRSSSDDVRSPDWASMRETLGDVSRDRAKRGFSPGETATFIFSLKQPIFDRLREQGSTGEQMEAVWSASTLLDALGLYTIEIYQKAREEIINRQQDEMLELSTPVVQLWDGILALPLIGTLDSKRTQSVMEALLQRIVETECEIAIIDITGVPTVDTLTAQHLLKTVTATRLMGAECIISGIRPQIAQTIVHLGVDLGEVTTKATLGGALATALQKRKLAIVKMKSETSAPGR